MRTLKISAFLLLAGLVSCIPPKPPVDPCVGKVCPPGTHCEKGICVPNPDPCAGVVCPAGKHCEAGKCVDNPPPASGRPTDAVYTDTMLRQEGGRLTVGGQPYTLAGAIPCWPTSDEPGSLKVDGTPVDYDWSLVSTEWMNATGAKGVNFFHIRPGPARANDLCCGLQSLGGPYAETSSLKLRQLKLYSGKRAEAPRLTSTWNQAYSERVYTIYHAAGKNKQGIESDVLDGWSLKHCLWGDPTCPPWPAEDIANVTKLPLNSSVKTWVWHWVYDTCLFANGIYQISNESEQIPGWTPEWERAMYSEIRAAEQQPGCDGKVIHMIGSNTRDGEGPYDYYEVHDGDAGTFAGRPLMQNEYNPHETPATFQQKFCDAAKNGTAHWYWRSDGSDADQDASLNALNCDSPPPTTCQNPLPPKDELIFQVNCNDQNVCDITPNITKDHEYCSGIGMSEYNGQPRYTCPIRNECGPTGKPNPDDQDPENPGPSFQCDLRLSCEQYVMERAYPLVKSDGNTYPVDSGMFRWKCDGGTYLEACDASETHCSRGACR